MSDNIGTVVDNVLIYNKNSDNNDTIVMMVGDFFYGEKSGGQKPPKLLNPQQIKCLECAKVLNGNIRFMLHMKHKLFNYMQSMENDPNMHNVCIHCHCKFEFPYQLEGHVEIVHTNDMNTPNYTCRICNKWWAKQDKTKYLKHMNITHVQCEAPFRCKVCHFSTSMVGRLLAHFKLIHPATGNLMCHICCHVFKTVEGFTYHIRQHRANRHPCTKCCLVFASATDLQKHVTSDHKSGTININRDKVQRNLCEKSTVIIHPPTKSTDKRLYAKTAVGEKRKVHFSQATYSRPMRARGRPSNHYKNNSFKEDDLVDCKLAHAAEYENIESGLVSERSNTSSELSDSNEYQNGDDEECSTEDTSGSYTIKYSDEDASESSGSITLLKSPKNRSSEESKETDESLEEVKAIEDDQCNSSPTESDQFTLEEQSDEDETLFSEGLVSKSVENETLNWYDSSLFEKLHGSSPSCEPFTKRYCGVQPDYYHFDEEELASIISPK